MKNMKSKLLASVAMLVVSTIMLTSASFAWFTISTAPEIKGLTTQVVVNDNLEIALDKDYANEAAVDAASAYTTTALTGNAYTWGNLLALGDVDAYKATTFSKELRPAQLATGAFKYPTYGTDGRISGLGDLAQTNMTGDAFGNLTGENNHVYGYYVDFWIRSNKGGTVTLSTAADRIAGDTSTKGGGSTFTASSRVASPTATATDAEKVLSENIRIAFIDLSAAENETVNKVATAATTTVPKDGETSKPDGTAVFSGNVVKLTANEAKKVRMYVYLDGANVTNESASLSPNGEATVGTVVGGALNIQFALADIDTPMNVKTTG